MLAGVLAMLASTMLLASSGAAGTSVASAWVTTEPSIDGIFDPDEWAGATHVFFYHDTPFPPHLPDNVHFYFKNTATKLFILVDDLPDNDTGDFDYFGLHFDANLDGVEDVNITMQYFANSSLSPGDKGNPMGVAAFGFGSTVNKAASHTVIEIAINITMDGAYDGESDGAALGNVLPVGTAGKLIAIQMTAAPPVCGWSFPKETIATNVTSYAMLSLATGPAIPGYEGPWILVAMLLAVPVAASRARNVQRRS